MEIVGSRTYIIDFSATADGTGLYHMEKGTIVNFWRATVEIVSYDPGEWHGYLNLYHDTDAHECGLCYTDKGISREVNAMLASHSELKDLIYDASGSEQGMQEARMLSMDVSVRKPKSMSREKLEELDYEIETY